MELEALQSKQSRAQWVYETLREDIKAGRYRGGHRIREEEIAQRLGVSRTPVREALSRLQHHGLLEASPEGLAVTVLSRPQVLELYAMREVLEGAAARFAAQHASPYEIADLRQIAAAFASSDRDPSRLAAINVAFHRAIYEAAHNRYLMRTLSELHDALALLQSTTFTVGGRDTGAIDEHGAILAAIEARDADAAELAARRHIQRALEARLQMIFSLG